MYSLRQYRTQHHAQTAGTARLATVAVILMLNGTQASTARGADTLPAEVTATPKVVRPASSNIETQPMRLAVIEKLITDFRKARTACSTESVPAGFLNHVTKRGETPKMVIRQYWATLPLKEDFLKALLDRLNPGAPVKGLSSPFKPGTLLALPSATALSAIVFDEPGRNTGKTEEDEREAALHGDGNFAAGWVQFP